MLESDFKKEFIKRVEARIRNVDLDFIHNNPNFMRSAPDLIILGPKVWAALEFKESKLARRRPNQEYHIQRLSEKGFASFVYPENSEEILDGLEKLFKS